MTSIYLINETLLHGNGCVNIKNMTAFHINETTRILSITLNEDKTLSIKLSETDRCDDIKKELTSFVLTRDISSYQEDIIHTFEIINKSYLKDKPDINNKRLLIDSSRKRMLDFKDLIKSKNLSVNDNIFIVFENFLIEVETLLKTIKE